MTVNATFRPFGTGRLRVVIPLLSPFLVAAAYYLGAETAFAIGTLTHQFAPFWPPNVVLFCAFALTPPRQWPLYIAAAFPAHLLAEHGAGMPLVQITLAFGSNVAVALLNGSVLCRLLPRSAWLGDLRNASLYLLVAVLASPASIGFVAAFEPILSGGDPGRYWHFWWRWYLSNALGNLTLTPLFLAWFWGALSRHRLAALTSGRLIEAALLGLGLAVSCTVAFDARLSGEEAALFPALLYLPVPLVLAAAVRFGGKGASGAILIVTFAVLYRAMHGQEPFASGPAGYNVVAMQLFLAAIAIPAILLAATVEESRRANAGLSRAIQEAMAAEQAASSSQDLLQSSLDAMNAHVAILDRTGTIIAANNRWQEVANLIAPCGEHYFLGDSYLDECERGRPHQRMIAAGLRRVVAGDLQEFRCEYASDFVHHRWFQMRGARFESEDGLRLVVSHEDITEVKDSETALRRLTAQLMRAQDQERRRIARELHDSTAQGLLAAMLGIRQAMRQAPSLEPASMSALDESLELLDQAQRELRTVAYLLHPPMLDEAGLPAALRWFCAGFTRRTEIAVCLAIAPDIERLSMEIESALFRIAQEGLTNAHRHSGCTAVSIDLSYETSRASASQLTLMISDNGRGMPSRPSARGHRAIGIGIAGMRERLHQLGGRLEIRSTSTGTALKATVPLAARGALDEPSVHAVSRTAEGATPVSGSNIQRTTSPATIAPAIGASQS